MLTLDGCGGNKSGLEWVEGKPLERSDAAWAGSVFQSGRKSKILISVRKTAITVIIDDRKIVDWKGDRTRLALPPDWPMPNSKVLWVGTWDSLFQIHQLSLTVVSGQGRKLR